MIQYDNMSTLHVLCRMAGSVFPHALPTGLLGCAAGTALAVIRKLNHTEDVFGVEHYIVGPLACQIMATAIGYLLVMRTNMALDRWMNAITQIEIMLSKWADSYNAMNSFFAGKRGTPAEMERIRLFRIRTAHWFSLMSCLAFATLRGRELRSLDEVSIVPKYPRGQRSMSFKMRRSSHRDSEQRESRRSSMSNEDERTAACRRPKSFTAVISHCDLSVLHAPTSEEVSLLEPSSDKVNTLCLWIMQGIMLEVRAKTLDAPPPIVTRVFQEISNGMLGFHQALKLALVPFPFPFSQMVAMLLSVIYVMMPFYIDIFTKNIVLTPVISFVVPCTYCVMNHLSIELEDPFHFSYNEIDVELMNDAFLEMLEDTLWGELVPPATEGNQLERAVHDGIKRSRALKLESALHMANEVVAKQSSSHPAYDSTAEDRAVS